MTDICVLIDCSGSMACMSKSDIVHTVCRNLYFHSGYEFKFYTWGNDVKEITYETDGLHFDFLGRNNLISLLEFIRNNESSVNNYILLTDGFIDGDKQTFSSFIRDSHNINFRLVGIGADWDKVMSTKLFPQNFIATEDDKNKLIFSSLDLEAVLESFL